jgi:hypothetical protein
MILVNCVGSNFDGMSFIARSFVYEWKYHTVESGGRMHLSSVVYWIEYVTVEWNLQSELRSESGAVFTASCLHPSRDWLMFDIDRFMQTCLSIHRIIKCLTLENKLRFSECCVSLGRTPTWTYEMLNLHLRLNNEACEIMSKFFPFKGARWSWHALWFLMQFELKLFQCLSRVHHTTLNGINWIASSEFNFLFYSKNLSVKFLFMTL